KMREEFDDENIIPPWDKMLSGDFEGAIKDVSAALVDLIETKRDFEDHLRDEGFSATAAKSITSGGYEDRTEPRDGADGLDELLASVKRASATFIT
ncbi:MAG: hypothetical protein ACE5G5_12975, partial [Candidatus Methylomirabilales bacterium]